MHNHDLSAPMTPSQKMLVALNRTKNPGEVYQGTVPEAEKARRRAANKVARKQRRANRLQVA